MKVNKLWAAAALTLALVSCKNEPAKEPEQQGMKFPVSLSIEGNEGALRAEQIGSTSPAASYPNERAVENLTVVVFTHNNTTNTPIAVEKVITYDKFTKTAGSDPYQGNYQFDMGIAGTYQLEVIANGYKDNTDKAAFIGKFPVGMSYEQFKKVVFERALPNHGETGFAMLSTEPAKVITLANTTANAGKIRLRRLACRFDVFNKLVDELQLTKVTLQNQTVKSYMMTQTAVPTGASNAPKEYTKNSTWFTPTVVSAGIYSYENPTPGAVTLKLEGTYNSQAWEKTIELRDKDGNYVATQRNHIYRVHLTKGNGTTPGGGDENDKDKITYNIEVLDWDEDNTFDYSDNDVWNAEQIKRINPLAYVAEYNIDKNGTDFVKDLYATNVSGYYDFDTAVAKFSSFEKDGVKYHLPAESEWYAIVPERSDYVVFNRAFEQLNFSQEVLVAGKDVDCVQDAKGSGNNKSYALRFRGTKYQSAWRYEYVKEGGNQVMKITSRIVADGVTIADVAKEDFWKNSTDDIVRIFPASGYTGNSSGPAIGDGKGLFWCTTKSTYKGTGMRFDEEFATTTIYSGFIPWQNVRLFKDRL